MIVQLFLLIAATAGAALADRPGHDIFFTMIKCEAGQLLYDAPLLFVIPCDKCHRIGKEAIKFSCTDRDLVEVYSDNSCKTRDNDDDDDLTLLQLSSQECTEENPPKTGIIFRTFDFGYSAPPEKTTTKRDLEVRDADKVASAPVATSSASTLGFVPGWLALLALTARWL